MKLKLTLKRDTIILFTVHSIRFVKYVFSAKIWFMKTSTRIMKYESRVIKSYLHYKTITSQNVSYEAEVKNFLIL